MASRFQTKKPENNENKKNAFQRKIEKPKDLFCLEGISCVSFNKDFTQVALSKKNNLIYIYSIEKLESTSTWKLTDTLDEHVLYISALSWHPITNRILSCSHDKTCNIWTLKDGKWKAELVQANVKLSLLAGNWNARGDLICLGSSCCQALMGYFDMKSELWVTIKGKHAGYDSSVVCVNFSPDSLLMISGTSNCTVFITTTYSKSINKELFPGIENEERPFGTVVYKFTSQSWVDYVNFSLNGKLAFVAENREIIDPATKRRVGVIDILDFTEGKNTQIFLEHGAAHMLIQKSENTIYVVDYQRMVRQYDKENGKWVMKKCLTESKLAANQFTSMAQMKDIKGVSNLIKGFQSMSMQNKDILTVKAEQFENQHGGLITSVNFKGNIMVTTDIGGYIKFWKV